LTGARRPNTLPCMARPLRVQFRNGWYHVTARGNNRHRIYFDERDRRHFLELLLSFIKPAQVYCPFRLQSNRVAARLPSRFFCSSGYLRAKSSRI